MTPIYLQMLADILKGSIQPQNVNIDLQTPRRASGYSPELTVGGKTGRFNFNVPPEFGGTPYPRHAFDTNEGGRWNYQLEKSAEGGRWEEAWHAEDDYKRYSGMDLEDAQKLMYAMWGNSPIAEEMINSLIEKEPWNKVKKKLKQYDTWRQISYGEPTP